MRFLPFLVLLLGGCMTQHDALPLAQQWAMANDYHLKSLACPICQERCYCTARLVETDVPIGLICQASIRACWQSGGR